MRLKWYLIFLRKLSLMTFGIAVLTACNDKSATNEGNSEKHSFVKVKVSVQELKFSTEVTFDPNGFAKVAWIENNNQDSSYEIYLHRTTPENKGPNINALLLHKTKEGNWELLADNLKDLYGQSKSLSEGSKSNISITIGPLSLVDKINIKPNDCCSTQCSNGRTMTCCSACCADPTQGCPQCCAQ